MTKRFTAFLHLGLVALTLLGLAACGSPTLPTPTSAPLPTAAIAPATAAMPTSTTAPSATAPVPTAQPTATVAPSRVAAPDTQKLTEQFTATFPKGAYDGVRAMALTVPAGQPPLWVVFTTGMRDHDQTPFPSHLVAVYAYEAGAWKELARQRLDEGNPAQAEGLSPDYIDTKFVAQARMDPSHFLIAMPGGAGAHSGTFQVLIWDGKGLTIALAAMGAGPGFGSLEDLNGDGVPEAVLDQSDAYVFCYACGVRAIHYQVYSWDKAQASLSEVTLKPLTSQGTIGKNANRAVELAKAGLWEEALTAMATAMASSQSIPASDEPLFKWDEILIRLHTDAMQQAIAEGPYPLLANVFYGDYAAALEIMRPYTPALLFDAENSPLITGTVAMNFIPNLTEYITTSVASALALEPELAPAYFIRGWAEYVANPADPAALADVQKAAALDAKEPLYAQAATWLASKGSK